MIEKLKTLNNEAQTIFQKNLYRNTKALQYLYNRGITDDAIKTFGLGFSNGKLLKDLKTEYSQELLFESGLLNKSGQEMFEKRIIFPIYSVDNVIAGFGGRTMIPDFVPKYINSKTNALYSKSNILYGLNSAERTDTIIICEGYMDLIAMQSHSIGNSCAVLGTALTDEHVQMLKEYGYKNFILLFDTDAPGRLAVKRSIKALNYSNNIIIPDLKPAKDPDEFIKRFGADKFKDKIKVGLNTEQFMSRTDVTELVNVLIRRKIDEQTQSIKE